jgi:hypothetical protein
MATTKQDILYWLERGLENGCTHLLVVCDTFEYEEYPVYIYPKGTPNEKDDVQDAIDHFNGPNMQIVMEVYNFSMDIQSQLSEYRAWNI